MYIAIIVKRICYSFCKSASIIAFIYIHCSISNHAVAFNVQQVITDNFKSCFIFPGTAIVPEESGQCTANISIMSTHAALTAAAVFTGISVSTLGIGTVGAVAASIAAASAMVLMDTGIFFGIGTAIANGASLCDYSGHPYPYTDKQISVILKSQGVQPTIPNIADVYDKMCIQYFGKKFWIGANTCQWHSAALFCGFLPLDSDLLMCVRASSTCPCSINIAGGHMFDPEYKTDSKGVIQVDKRGNPQLADEAAWRQGYLKHCRLLNVMDVPPFPGSYNGGGIVDETCNSMVGYSKNQTPITAGVVQCIENTVRNIFEKPIVSVSNSATAISLNTAQAKILAEYSSDIKVVNEAINLITGILNGASANNVANAGNIESVKNIIRNIRNLSIFGTQTGPNYGNTVQVLSVSQSFPNNVNILDLVSRNVELGVLLNEIRSKSASFTATQAQRNKQEQNFTTFQTLQSRFKVLALIIIILWITTIGLKIIFEDFSISFKTLIPYVIRFGMVYYFAIGSAWKDYFFGMLFSVSHGFGTMMLSFGISGDDVVSKACDFSKNYYIPENPTQPGSCSYPNPNASNGSDPKDPFIVAIDNSGQQIIGCLKGPYIQRPNYEQPYKPVIYTTIQNGQKIESLLQLYCLDSANNTVPATILKDPITNQATQFQCPSGTIMEDGYRVSEYIKLGLSNVTQLDTNTNYQLIKTARQILNEQQSVTDVVAPHDSTLDEATNNSIRALDTRARINQTAYLESVRTYMNRTERMYPTINRYGTQRDMSYIGIFDAIDCKLQSYLTFQLSTVGSASVTSNNVTNNSASVRAVNTMWAICFSMGAWGLIIMILGLVIALLLIGVIGKVLQVYLMSIIAVVILVYLSPITIPLCLFDRTKNYYESWLQLLRQYVTYPPLLFLLLAFTIKITDYVIFGAASTYETNNMFASDGTIDGVNCWANDLYNAPLLCLIKKISMSVAHQSVLGIRTPTLVGVNTFDILPKLALQAFKTVIIIYVLFEFVEKMENVINSIFGKGPDGVNTGVFDKIGAVSSYAKEAGGHALGIAKRAYNATQASGQAAAGKQTGAQHGQGSGQTTPRSATSNEK